jgi:signal peptidase II
MRVMQTAARASLSGATTESTRPRGLFGVLVAVFLVVYAADQITKVVAVDRLGSGRRIEVVGHWLRFELTHNSGAAGSLAAGQTGLLTVVAIVVVAAVLRIVPRAGLSLGWSSWQSD